MALSEAGSVQAEKLAIDSDQQTGRCAEVEKLK